MEMTPVQYSTVLSLGSRRPPYELPGPMSSLQTHVEFSSLRSCFLSELRLNMIGETLKQQTAACLKSARINDLTFQLCNKCGDRGNSEICQSISKMTVSIRRHDFYLTVLSTIFKFLLLIVCES